MITRLEFQVNPDENKLRLEDLLCKRLGGLSKMYLREVVKNGACEVNGRVENVGKRMLTNDYIEIWVDLEMENSMVPQEMPLDILHEDAHLIVVNKPVGMLVHPSHREKTGTLLNALSFHLNKEGTGSTVRPGLVHRLDRETSGLLVIAKTPEAHRRLASQFQKKRVEKTYIALVPGSMEQDDGTIEGSIGRFPEEKRWGIKADGKYALSKFRVIERLDNNITRVEIEPVTGRTNQLRIHCASIGHPIIGDISRGGPAFRRLCLHAARLSFDHPNGSGRLTFKSKADF